MLTKNCYKCVGIRANRSNIKTTKDFVQPFLSSVAQLQKTVRIFKNELCIIVWTIDKRTLYTKFISASVSSRQSIIVRKFYDDLKKKNIDKYTIRTLSINRIPTADIVSRFTPLTDIFNYISIKCEHIDILVSENIYE